VGVNETLWRTSFFALAVLGTAFFIAWIEIVGADWRHCFARMSADPASRYLPMDHWGIALKALLPPSMAALFLLAIPMLPAIAAITLVERSLIAGIAIAPMLVLLFSVIIDADPAHYHHCDRKGAGGMGIVVVLWILQLPVGAAVLLGAGIHRLRPLLQRNSTT
jgi:hypothetical protein